MTWISADVEADGPIPGVYSMLSFAAVAYDEHGTELSYFQRNLQLLEGASQHEETMKWWDSSAELRSAYRATRKDQRPAHVAMGEFESWLIALMCPRVFVSWPVTFDHSFLRWYLLRHGLSDVVSYEGFDIGTAASIALKKPFHLVTLEDLPERWLKAAGEHTHDPLADARFQGRLLFEILRELESH